MAKTYWEEGGILVRETETAIVRVIPGKLSKEELVEVLTHAGRRFALEGPRRKEGSELNALHR